MRDSETAVIMVFILFWILIGIAGSCLAIKKNRNYIVWFLNCLISGVFSLLVLGCSSKLEYDETSEEWENDVLGGIILCINIILVGLAWFYGKKAGISMF